MTRFNDPSPLERLVDDDAGNKIQKYAGDILRAVEIDPEIDKDPRVQLASAVIDLAAMETNTILHRIPSVEKPAGIYHTDSPNDTKIVRVALPHLIDRYARQLTSNQIDAAIAQLNKARRPTCPTK